MQPADVNPSMYIDFNIEKNKESPKFKFVIIECKVCDNRMLICIYIYIYIYIYIFAKDYFSNWSEQVSVIRKVTNVVPWTSYY